MKAFLLAAGTGSRISKDVQGLPKSLLPVGEKPLLHHTIELLQKNRVEVVVITGYRHELIEESIRHFRVETIYNPFFAVTNSMGSLWYAKHLMSTNEMLVANADVFYSQAILDKLFASDGSAVMLADSSRVLEGDYFFQTENGVLCRYGKELAVEERDCEYVGVSLLRDEWVDRFKARMCTMVETGKYNLWWENVLYSFVEDGTQPIHTLDINGLFWSEVDTMHDYERVLAYHKQVLAKPPEVIVKP